MTTDRRASDRPGFNYIVVYYDPDRIAFVS